MIDILIVDDHAIFKEGLKSVLTTEPTFNIIGEADNGDKVLELVKKLKPQIILLDLNMPYSGLNTAKDVFEAFPDAKIIILTVSENENDLIKAVKIGAKGYLLKNMGMSELISSIKSVANGGAIFTPLMANKLLDDYKVTTKIKENKDDLTSREIEVLNLVANGDLNKEIAYKLDISESTVKAHLRNILSKLHVKNRSQAAVFATKNNKL